MAGWSGLSAGARGAALVGAAAVVAVAGYFGFGRGPDVAAPLVDAAAVQAPVTAPEAVASPEETSAAETAAPQPAAASPAPVTEDGAVAQDVPAQAASDAAADGAGPAILPRFDVARVAPDGAATVAGVAAPGAAVAVMIDGATVATAVADGQGKFAALFDVPPSPAPRLLSLQATGADGVAATGAETVALAPVAGAAAGSSPQDVLQAPATVLVAPEGVKVLQPAGEAPAEVAANVVVETISYAPDGAVMLGGRAAAGAGLRIYLDGAVIADVSAAPDGTWATRLADVAAGIYTLRVDQLAADGTVSSRFESQFKRETLEALSAASGAAATGGAATAAVSADAADVADAPDSVVVQPVPDPAPAADSPVAETAMAGGDVAVAEGTEADPAPVADAATVAEAAPMAEASTQVAPAPVVADAAAEDAAAERAVKPAPVSVTVQPGYTLWGIAQQNFGDGVMYVQVFEANKDKIKDPDLIYPGQVFTIPAAP